ncbi:MAG: fimbrillin family protein, partial [Alistipes sp.]|nr:fimbrillin family protein [Alistipes sp.]
MKNWLNLIFVGGVMLLMGCSTQSDFQAPASETKDIRFGISQQQARAYFAEDPAGALCVGWDLGDGIGISATKDGEPFGANYEYRVKESLDEGASAVLTASSTQYTYRWSEEAAYTFYGYYPYTGTPDAEPHYLTSVSLPAEQPQAAVNDFSHLQAWWVMKAEPY